MNMVGVILAAGTSSRMGSTNKLLLKYKNHTVIEEVLVQLSAAGLDEIIIVTGFEHDRINEVLAKYLTDRIKIILNEKYIDGRSESIKCAVRHIHAKVDAALFMVADKPGINSKLINRAVDLYRKKRPAILYVETPRGRGHPIIFSRKVFDDLLLLKGDKVGNELIEKYKDELVTLKDDHIQIDIDFESDYRILMNQEYKQET